MNTPADHQAAATAAPVAPGYVRELADRGAVALMFKGDGSPAEFTYFSDGKDTAFVARWYFGPELIAPVARVFRARCGSFVCQSLEGNAYEVDPKLFCGWQDSLPSDEWRRGEWIAAQQVGKAARAG